MHRTRTLCENLCKGNTEEKIVLFIAVLLFVHGGIFNSGNFTSCFFQSNGKWVYAFNRNIFYFQILHIIIFLHKDTFFSYNSI